MTLLRSALLGSLALTASTSASANSAPLLVAANDECGTATAVTVGATAFDTSTATPSASSWQCNGSGNDVWFTYTSTGSGAITVDTLGSTFDTVMMVWSGNCASASYLGCNDDVGGGPLQSSYTITGSTAGATYIFRVGGYNGANGAGTLNVAQVEPLGSATGLIISEYVDGKNNNDGIEIYNGTAHTVDLSDYMLRLYQGNSQTANVTSALSGVLASGEVAVFVKASGNTNNITGDLNARGIPYSTLAAVAFTGDDSLELCDSAGTSIDVLGEIGFDPGNYWGAGSTTTYEDTLRRKSTIARGRESASFDPSIEYDGYPRDTFSGLGVHEAPIAVFVSCDVTNNSSGTPATLSASGSTTVTDNDLTLTVAGLPTAGTTAFLFNAFLAPGQSLVTVPNPTPGGGPAAGGDVCIAGGTFGRHVFGSDVFIGTSGTFSITVDLTDVPSPRDGVSFPNPGHYSTAVLSGETWYWQCWYRDQAVGVGESNFSESIAITFQ